METIMMSDLPPDLVEEILSRVPSIALSRFRSTCKRWNTLFKDKRFTKKHFDKAAKKFVVLMLNEYMVSPLSINLHGIDHNNIAAPFIEFKGELALKDSHSSSSEQVDIFQVFHCDGLLLCNTRDKLVVWNPCTGERKWMRSSNHHDYNNSNFALGYENNKSSSWRNYKLLRYSNYYYNSEVVEFEIYEFSTSSWRILNLTDSFKIRSRGVSLKGNTYWFAYDDNILCFDFSTERLGRLCLPFQASNKCTTALTTVSEEQLSVLHNNFDSSKKEIWVTTNEKIDHTVVLSWSKLFAIDLNNFFNGLGILSCASFFIDEEKKVVVCCDSVHIRNTIKNKVYAIGGHGVYRKIYFEESIQQSEQAIIFNYVPSLVQIRQG